MNTPLIHRLLRGGLQAHEQLGPLHTKFAVGGTEALRTLDSQCATLLLEQIRTNEAALFDVKAVSLPDRLPRVRNRD